MPRYFFHIVDDLDIVDEQGADLSDLDAARDHAITSARALMCETLKDEGRITLHHRIDIEDDRHSVVGSVKFGDSVKVEP